MNTIGYPFQPPFHFDPIAQAEITISGKHADSGGDTGILGPATSAVMADQTEAHGYHVDYKNGHIYWSPASGAHTITGAIYEKWTTQGGPKSGFTFPITDEVSTADNKCRFNNFNIGAIYFTPATGSIYWSGQTQAHTVYGDIRNRYLPLGGPTSWLGLPTTDETPIPGATGRMNKFEAGAIYWYRSADSILVQRGLRGPSYTFSVDTIACNVTRSAHRDTLHISVSVSVAIAGRDPTVKTKSLGDHKEGFTFPGIPLTNIPIADDEIAVFTYVIINNGHSTESEVHKLLETAATKIATTGGAAAAQAIGEGAKAAAGAAIGALVGSPISVVGPIIGAALGALSAFLLGELIDVLNPNCDGPIASAAMTIGGAELRQRLAGGQPWSHKDSNPGVDSPGGCGANSEYETTWSIPRA